MSFRERFLEEFTEELILNSAPFYVLDQIEKNKRKEFMERMNINLEPTMKIETKNFFEKREEIPIPKEFKKEDVIIKPNGMEKIQNFLDDPLVTELECMGPEKFLLVHRDFDTKSIENSLSKSEIESILSYFSKESRIPLSKGIFRAIIKNLVINAIDSEFGGPRFIITKIHPRKSEYL